jgi:hypothetical protein
MIRNPGRAFLGSESLHSRKIHKKGLNNSSDSFSVYSGILRKRSEVLIIGISELYAEN